MAQYLLSFVLIVCFVEKGNTQKVHHNFYQIQKEMETIYTKSKRYGGSYKQWKRAEYYLQNRLDIHGKILNTENLNADAWNKYNKGHHHVGAQRAYSGDWEFFGPYLIEGNSGIGRINRIAFHPTDPDIIYIATAGGGLQYTNNHGINWAPLTESLPINNISGVVVDYEDPDIIYIFTGDGDGCCGGARRYFLRKSSGGILKSTDGGETWQTTGLVFEEEDLVWPYDLVQHPVVPEVLLAATNEGVYLSLTAADTWTKVLDTKTYELHFNPDQPSIIFAISDESVFRSTTSGIAWDTIPIPLLDSMDGRMTMSICAQDPDIIYLAASPEKSDSSGCRGFFISINGGIDFSLVTDTPNIVDYQPYYDLTMICNPVDDDDVIIGAVRHWKTTNAGGSFASTGGTHVDIHDLQVNPLNNRLYSANDGGLDYSDDFGTTWTYMAEYCAITQYYKIAVSQQNVEVLIAGSQDNGTHRSRNAPTTEMKRIHHGDGMDCAIHPSNDSLMIYSIQNGDFWISRDQGESEIPLLIIDSLPESVRAIWVTPVAWDANDTNNIFIGYDPIYRSFDMGATFSPIPDTISGRRILHVASANGQRLYAGDQYSVQEDELHFHLWTSEDQGSTWTPVHTGLGFPNELMVITSLCTHPEDDEEVWIAMAGYESGKKVYRSMDAGATWTNMSGSLPNTPVNTIILQHTSGTGNYTVYVGTDIGVFYTDGGLGDWIPFSNGMPVVEIADLKISETDQKILAGTHGRGIWMADLHSSCEEVIHVTYSLQNDDQSYFFQAADSIISSLPIHNSYGIQVTYRSGHVVVLEEGFRATAQLGALFRALHGDCDEGGVPLPMQGPDGPSVIIENNVGYEFKAKAKAKAKE